MSVEENKQVVQATWHALVRGDVTLALGNMADEITWLIPGNFPGTGLKKNKAEIEDTLNGIRAAAGGRGPQMEVKGVYGEDDVVIIELSSRFKSANGKLYENEYCFVYELKNGKIVRIREYMDTQKAKDFLFG